MHADEDLLQRVLGVGGRPAEHLPGISEQAHAVAIVDRPEGFVRPGAEQCDQLIVRA